MIVTDERVAAFVGRHNDTIICPPFTAMGIERDGEIIAGVIFNNFTGPDCHMSVAGQGWTKGFLADIGDYVFHQMKCIRMTAVTEQPKVVRLAERLGGKLEGLMRDHFGKGRDGFVIGFLEREWKF